MSDFMLHFLLCNVLISGIIMLLLFFKWIGKNSLSSRMQYHLWLLLLGLLVIPFLPLSLHAFHFSHIFSKFQKLMGIPGAGSPASVTNTLGAISVDSSDWLNDFVLSVNSHSPSVVGHLLFGIWIAGIFAMLWLVGKSLLRLHALKDSALPLQSQAVRRLNKRCLYELNIAKDIPIYSTAFLKSPIMAGLFKPCIYLPIHLVSDYCEKDMRYMLLHELQHYKHKDALAGYLMNLAGVIYWFNPFVWYALREMKNDREIACDASVMLLLKEEEYEEYGNTLIRFAEKISLTPFSFASGMSSSMKQLKKRMIHIASFEKPTAQKKVKGVVTFLLTAALLSGFVPLLSAHAAEPSHYQWNISPEDTLLENISSEIISSKTISSENISSGNISLVDLSAYFEGYAGSFVLYDLKNDIWNIYDMEHATARVSPDSTYKIYSALFALEEGIITPEDSYLAWNGENYPFDAWNRDQTLNSAMSASVNWYFQTLDKQLGYARLHHYIRKIGYGNKDISSSRDTFWMESSLQISPIEQIELLKNLQNNSLDFAPENIRAVKDSIRLFSSDTGTFYGKTGTGRIDGKDVNGWFIGFSETADNTCFFAVNIGAKDNASGKRAADIALSILSDMGIW